MSQVPARVRLRAAEQVSEPDAAAVLSAAQACAGADGVGPLSEAARLAVRYGGGPASRNLLLWQDDDLAGFAYVAPGEPTSAELFVAPTHRRQGLGRQLAEAVLANGAARVRIWAHGDLPAAATLARALSFTRSRELWLMHRPLADPAGAPRLPPGITLRPFVPGQDEQAWLAVNRRAFANHPEQGNWTLADLARRQNEPWFDPAGFLLAERDGHLAGFHWTKIHQSSPAAPGEPAGEVYVVGVDPAEQGTGLGRALTVAGLEYLRGRGLPEVVLYVDAGNAPAVRMYESMGFGRAWTDVMYERRGI